MSEVSNCQKRISQLKERLDIFLGRFPSKVIDDQNEDLIVLITEWNHIRSETKISSETLDRLIEKSNKVDPVSGDRRFGPNTILKIETMKTTFEVIQQSVTINETRIEEYFELHKPALEVTEAVFTSPNNPLVDLTHQFNNKENESRGGEEVKDPREEEALMELSRRAQEAREARRKALLAREAAVQQLKLEMEDWVAMLAGLAQGPEALKPLLQEMYMIGTSADEMRPRVKEAVGALIAILGNIASRPDDTSLRTLSTTNDKLQQHVLTLGEGAGQEARAAGAGGGEGASLGLRAVIACGFSPTIRWKPDSTDGDSAEAEMDGGGTGVGVGGGGGGGRPMRMRKEDLGEVILVMEEPSPEGPGGTAAWVEWFDRVCACKSLLEEFLAAHK